MFIVYYKNAIEQIKKSFLEYIITPMEKDMPKPRQTDRQREREREQKIKYNTIKCWSSVLKTKNGPHFMLCVCHVLASKRKRCYNLV